MVQRQGMISEATSRDFLDRSIDVDSHEMIPVHMWPEVFGPAAETFTKMCNDLSLVSDLGDNTLDRSDLKADDVAISEESVWSIRGPGAPSAIDLRRRPEAMDRMGIHRQLVFPTFALAGLILVYNPKADKIFKFDAASVDRMMLGRQIVQAHNEWAIRGMRDINADRLRPVGVILTESVDSMVAQVEDLVAKGIRGIMLPAGVPPANMSPADRRLDTFWEIFTKANIPALLHLGTEFAFLSSGKWSANVPEFAPSLNASVEFNVEPYWGSTMNFASENFLTTMVLGGVFERHPMLRFGCIELGAQWIGPLAERLDLWASQFSKRLSGLKAKPSEYINRNVRVTPFYFEDVRMYLDRYPNIANSYCFSTDFPHVEGGKYAKRRFAENLTSVNVNMQQKFFVENGEWLLPT